MNKKSELDMKERHWLKDKSKDCKAKQKNNIKYFRILVSDKSDSYHNQTGQFKGKK